MCGIAGFVAPDLSELNIDAALASIAHRGPDSRATFQTNFPNRQLLFGHTRLAIVDLRDAGSQPMTEAGVTIVFNGEIYNYQRLKAEYLSGENFVSLTDTEVVLKLYRRFGASFVDLLEGDFALAILDQAAAKLLLIRDRLGVKPLYLYRDAETFAFASEIKVFRAAGLPLRLNRAEIGKYLVFKYSPLQHTLFTEVERLAPGHLLTINLANGHETLHRYWSLSASAKPFEGHYSDAKILLREKIQTAVESQLIGDVPIANLLSGGIDSSIIAHYLRDGGHTHYCAVKQARDLRAEGTTSDGYYAQKIATEWGLSLREISIGASELTLAHIDKAVWACDDLIADGSVIPAMEIAREAARDHKVVLSGMGADELFLGYSGHFLLRLSRMADRIPALKSALGKALRRVDAGQGGMLAYRRYLRKWGENWGKDYETGRYSVVGDVDSALAIFKGSAGHGEVFSQYFNDDRDAFDQLMAFETDNFLVKNLHYLDRSSMAYGLESRVPFLDHRLVEFAAGLPANFKLGWRLKSKRILKDAYSDILPSYVTRRRKAGFGMPLRTLLQSEDRVAELLPIDFFGDMGCFDVAAIRRIVAEHRSGQTDQSALIYSLIVFRRWHALFFEGEQTPDAF